MLKSLIAIKVTVLPIAEGTLTGQKDGRRPVTPEQAQRAKKNLKRAANLERVIKTATL